MTKTLPQTCVTWSDVDSPTRQFDICQTQVSFQMCDIGLTLSLWDIVPMGHVKHWSKIDHASDLCNIDVTWNLFQTCEALV